jgi:hypothetical protein
MVSLVGYSGFVGSNIVDKLKFDNVYNSRNIEMAFGTNPDLLLYSGVPSEMFLANTNPIADLAVCDNAADNIRKIAPKQIVLISSIAVLDDTDGVNEDYVVDTSHLTPYGANRLYLERLVREIIPDCHIIRLPALFGKGLKKNFIYDIINISPTMLNKTKYFELLAKEPLISEHYRLSDNGFYKLTENCQALKESFERIGFTALSFTDSRSKYQFYNLAYLWEHIDVMLRNDIPLLHITTEPLSANEVNNYVTGKQFVNKTGIPYYYDVRTKYSDLFNGKNGYMFSKEQVLAEIKSFVGG